MYADRVEECQVPLIMERSSFGIGGGGALSSSSSMASSSSAECLRDQKIR